MRIVQALTTIAFPRTDSVGPYANVILQGMMRSDQFGFYDALGHLLKVDGLRMIKLASDDCVYFLLSHLRGRYLEAKTIEALHGKGSLLNLNNPTVAMMIEQKQMISAAEIEAALDFREAHGVFCADWRAMAVNISPTS